MASKKDEGPNLMYNQLRKFISVVVSALFNFGFTFKMRSHR